MNLFDRVHKVTAEHERKLGEPTLFCGVFFNTAGNELDYETFWQKGTHFAGYLADAKELHSLLRKWLPLCGYTKADFLAELAEDEKWIADYTPEEEDE